MTTTTANNREGQTSLRDWIILAVVGVGGIGAAWGLQLVQGMGITGLGQRVVWGLYIAGFFSAMGAGASLVALAVSGEIFGAVPIDRRRSALLLALVSFVIAGLLIAMDIGNPLNVWRILTAGRFSSMMTWDFWALIVTGLLTLAYLVVSWRQTASTSGTRIIAIVASISGLALVVVEGWMLSAMSARPLWGGGLTVMSFLVGACVAGFSIALLAWSDLSLKLGRWLAIALSIMLVMVLIEMLTGAVEQGLRPRAEINQLLTGTFSPMFWVYLALGLVLPLGLLLWQNESFWTRAAAWLALLGVIAEKLWLLSAGQALPWLAMPEGFYSPTWVELLGIVGSIALGILVYRLVTQMLKVS